jgi:hypothetical protein
MRNSDAGKKLLYLLNIEGISALAINSLAEGNSAQVIIDGLLPYSNGVGALDETVKKVFRSISVSDDLLACDTVQK